MKCTSYNIHYGVGMDGAYDLDRIAASIADSDVIAIQEIGRNIPDNGGVDMIAALRAYFPDRFVAEGMAADALLGTESVDGRAVESRFQFGNVIVSRWPLLFIRNHLLPRRRSDARLNLQRGALEALIATPIGPLRVLSVHLDHLDAGERMPQIAAILDIVRRYGESGGAVTGLAAWGFEEMPLATGVLVMGDFNMEPDTAEYRAMLGEPRFPMIDLTSADPGHSFFDPKEDRARQRLDYIFADTDTATRLQQCMIDREATGSDHFPVHVILE